jgi:VanZ family protein
VLRSHWFWKLLALAGTFVLLALCLCPSSWLPVTEHASSIGLPTDKVAHVALFAQFTALWTMAGPRGRAGWRWRGAVLAAGLALAVATEAAQGLPLIARDPDPYDALADSVGALVGILVALPFVGGAALPLGD